MNSITIDLQQEQFVKLQSMAERLGVPLEDLARSSIEELVAKADNDFDPAAQYVLDKNSELYRRLAGLTKDGEISESFKTMLASETVLRRDWDLPEEDAAWADL
jgi:antitoxin FitA